jgi:hypothetical protein
VEEDQRRFPRFTVAGVQGKVSFAAHVDVVNLSLGGVAVKGDRRLELGREYTLRLELESRFVDVRGVAVWSKLTGLQDSNSASVPEYSAGFKFTNVLSDRVHDLIQFIEDNKGDEEERITGVRFQIQTQGKALLDTEETCEVKLISRSGMLIQASRRFDLERAYPMQIAPDPGQDPIRLTGRVASQLETTHGRMTRFDLGVEFLDMSDTDRARLDQYIDSLSQS